MQLTTPEAKEYDTAFPGENWFFFWRTSPSLWESKLSEYQGPEPIFIPLFWGLHCEEAQTPDFGNYRPETDLKRLFETAKGLNKELCLMLPIGPAPFLPNGGLPASLARHQAMDRQELVLAVIDNDDRLNKMYSFFDPRVYGAFSSFCNHLQSYLRQNQINAPIFAANNFYLLDGSTIRSFLDDRSPIFEKGFARYLAQKKEGGELDQNLKNNAHLYEREKENYLSQIRSLYLQTAQEAFGKSWGGEISFGSLGGAPHDLPIRSSHANDHLAGYFASLYRMLLHDLMPCSALLAPKLKKSALAKALKDIVSENHLRRGMKSEVYDDQYGAGLAPLVFFELVGCESDFQFYSQIGLTPYLNQSFAWCYRLKDPLDIEVNEEENIVRLYRGRTMNAHSFGQMLKTFLNGSTALIDCDELEDSLRRKLELFILENDLGREKINYVSPVTKITLGEGALFTFSGVKLREAASSKRKNFWETILGYLKIKHLNVQAENDVFYFWRKRPSNTFELDYAEIRRVGIYNTTSYKKKAKIMTTKNFAFMKTLDEHHSQVSSTPLGIEVVLWPGGSVSLDFGFYE